MSIPVPAPQELGIVFVLIDNCVYDIRFNSFLVTENAGGEALVIQEHGLENKIPAVAHDSAPSRPTFSEKELSMV